MKKVAIVILNFNGYKDTIECLESLNKLSIDNFEPLVVVVDNGSESKFKVQSLKFKVGEIKVIRNEENLGFSGGNNIGIKYALEQGSDYILILNNDTFVDKNLVKELIKTADSDTKIGIVSPKIYFAKGFEFHEGRYKKDELGCVFWYAGGIMDWKNLIGYHKGVDEVDNGQYDKIEETEISTGCCMMVKKEVFEKIGMLDERYFLYYEDSDLNLRAKKAGFKIIYSPKAILWHKNAGSGEGSGSSLQDYYISRNRLIFGYQYGSLRLKFALLRESFGLLISGRKWQKRGILDFYLRRFKRGSYKNE